MRVLLPMTDTTFCSQMRAVAFVADCCCRPCALLALVLVQWLRFEANLPPDDEQEPRNARALANDQEQFCKPDEGNCPLGCLLLQAMCLLVLCFLPLLDIEHLTTICTDTAVPLLL